MRSSCVEDAKIKCLFKCVRRKGMMWGPVAACAVLVALAAVSPALAASLPKDKDTPDISCSSVRYSYEGKGITFGDVPKDPLSGMQLLAFVSLSLCSVLTHA